MSFSLFSRVLEGGMRCVDMCILQIQPMRSFCEIFRKQDDVIGGFDLQQMWETLFTSLFGCWWRGRVRGYRGPSLVKRELQGKILYISFFSAT